MSNEFVKNEAYTYKYEQKTGKDNQFFKKESLTYFDKRLQTNSNFQIEFVSQGYLKHQNSIQQSLKNRFQLFLSDGNFDSFL